MLYSLYRRDSSSIQNLRGDRLPARQTRIKTKQGCPCQLSKWKLTVIRRGQWLTAGSSGPESEVQVDANAVGRLALCTLGSRRRNSFILQPLHTTKFSHFPNFIDK